MDPRGSTTHGKRNKREKERWDAVAEAIWEISAIIDRDDLTDKPEKFKDADDEDRITAYAIADSAIKLVDSLLVPALKKGMK